MAEFEIIKSGRTVRKVSFIDDVMIIGRDVLNELCLPDDIISRRHARIFVEKGQLTVEDLETKNGTFVNGRREYRRALANGDRIEFGTFTILVHMRPNERFADTPIQGQPLDEEGSEMLEGAFIANDDGPATRVVGQAALARMRQEHEIKLHPHLVLALGSKTALFPLKYQSTFIGNAENCQVRVHAMPRPRSGVLELKEDGSYEMKKLGLCVKLKVGGKAVKAAVVKDGETIELDGQSFTLKMGKPKAAARAS